MAGLFANFTPGASLAGGVLIGISAAALLLLSGRIAGITGILDGAFRQRSAERAWRLWFLVGLIGCGVILRFVHPATFAGQTGRGAVPLIAAGLLVGFGTRMGNGCTSGHGVCGVGRLSKRSFVATGVFIATGALTVFLARLVQEASR